MSIGKKIAGGFAVTLAILAGIGFISYRNIHHLLQNNERVVHTHEVIESLNDLRSLLKDMVSGQRSFLLTEDIAFLQPYTDGVNNLKEAQGKVWKLILNNVEQKERFKDLEEVIRTAWNSPRRPLNWPTPRKRTAGKLPSPWSKNVRAMSSWMRF
jgi:CHASE3 domain sensor protein